MEKMKLSGSEAEEVLVKSSRGGENSEKRHEMTSDWEMGGG